MSPENLKYKPSEDFYKFLVDSCEGALSPREIEILYNLFVNEASKHFFTSSSEANLIRIINSQFDKRAFLTESLTYNHHIEIIVAIASNSNYLTDILVRNPGYLYQIFDNDYLSTAIKYENLANEINTGLTKYKRFETKVNFLKNIKQRYLLKIAVNDLNGESLVKTTDGLSILAKAINYALFELCYTEILNKYEIKSTKRKYCLIALGKLGGNELNYSSDIDLMLFFDKNGKIGNSRKEYYEILEEATQLFIKSATQFTSKGYLYRVDFRLRPDGRHSPLARTLHDTITYYETKGEDWEKQMLIKSGYVCGSEKLYEEFQNFLQPFIYSQALNGNPAKAILRMKKNIESRSSDANVKLFQGGIRDIEFSVQALQLINGKRIPQLRTPNTLNAINILEQHKLLTGEEAETFRTAYIFYRKIEHFLQLMNDKQTHTLPDNEELFSKMVYFLGFKNKNEFLTKLESFRASVREIFLSITQTDNKETGKSNGIESVKFSDVNRSRRYFTFLQNGTGLLNQKQFDRKTIELFSEIENSLIDYLNSAFLPDKTIENFAKIIEHVKFPSIWYGEFKNEKFFRDFLDICQFSQQTVDILTSNINLGELLLNKFSFLPVERDELNKITLQRLLLILSIQFTLRVIDRETFSQLLTEYFHSEISKLIESLNLNYDLFIAGLGSFGIKEMTFNSDIDLIVVAKDVRKIPEVQNIFQVILSEMVQLFKPFKVDFRLRPEGEGSPLVWDIEGYTKYLQNRARVWEFQALTKLDFIWGNRKLYERFKNEVSKSLKNFPIEKILSETKEMYNTLSKQSSGLSGSTTDVKKSKGTLITLDFIVQYLLLKNYWDYKNSGMNFTGRINFLNTNKLISAEDAKAFLNNYLFLKYLELSIQNIFKTRRSVLPVKENKTRALEHFLNVSDIKNKLNKVILENVKLHEKYIR